MKAVFITYNQVITDKVDEILDNLLIRGYTQWVGVKGRGSNQGNPHMGSHTWPALNSAILSIIDEEKVDPLLLKIDELNREVEQQGIRAFVWDVEKTV